MALLANVASVAQTRSGPEHAILKAVIRNGGTALWLTAVSLFLILVSRPLRIDAADIRSKVTREADLKAAFLFNFAQFIDWPTEAFSNPQDPFVIAIFNDDPVAPSLERMVVNEVVRNRKMIVKRYRTAQDISACHILYISPSQAAQLDQIFRRLQGKNTLTVGETDGFAQREGMIRFLLVEDKLRLRINLQAATAAKLTISSKLLRQAEITDAK